MKIKSLSLFGTEIDGNYANISVKVTERGTVYTPTFSFLYKQDTRRRLDKLTVQRLARGPSHRKTPVSLKSPGLRAAIQSQKSATKIQKEDNFISRNKGLLNQKPTLKARIKYFFKRRTRK